MEFVSLKFCQCSLVPRRGCRSKLTHLVVPVHVQSTLIITKSAITKFRLMQTHIVGPGKTVHVSMERKSVTAKSHLAKFRLQRKFSLTSLPEKALLTIHL